MKYKTKINNLQTQKHISCFNIKKRHKIDELWKNLHHNKQDYMHTFVNLKYKHASLAAGAYLFPHKTP